MFPWLFVSLQMPLPSFCGQRKLQLEWKAGPLESVFVYTCSVTEVTHFLTLALSLAEPHTSRGTTILRHSCRALGRLYMSEGQGVAANHIAHVSSAFPLVPFPHLTSFSKHKFKHKIVNNFKR